MGTPPNGTIAGKFKFEKRKKEFGTEARRLRGGKKEAVLAR